MATKTIGRVGTRQMGTNSVYIFMQEINDEMCLKIVARKDTVSYFTLAKGQEGVEVMSELVSPRPYALGNPNDGTTKNALHALFDDFFASQGKKPENILKEMKPDALSFHKKCSIIGRREGIIVPKVWTKELKECLRDSLREVGLDWMAE